MSWSNGLWRSLQAARILSERHGVAAEVIDLRWLAPIDTETVVAHGTRSGRILIVDEGRATGGVSEGLVAAVVDATADTPGRPAIRRYCGEDSFIPLGPAAEHVLPSTDGIVARAVDLVRPDRRQVPAPEAAEPADRPGRDRDDGSPVTAGVAACRRVVVICPGRGSYGPSDLGSLSRPVPDASRASFQTVLSATDACRGDAGEPTLSALDGAERLTAAHSAGEHVSPLILACTAADFLRVERERCEVVAVAGNSLGWYSALFCAGALTLADTMRLVETMSGMGRNGLIGGQIVYPVTDDRWLADEDLARRVDAALRDARAAGHRVGDSIRYGGYRVLWGDDAGIRTLRARLPRHQSGERAYPLHLHGHAAFHSPLLADNARRAVEALAATVDWRAPEVPLIDGRGHQWSPLATDAGALAEYTLRTQVTSTFDFTACVRVALREYAPDLLVCLGPGDALAAVAAPGAGDEAARTVGRTGNLHRRARTDHGSMATPVR